ncbi:MAG: 2-oxoacid:acceptor oxidoreductase family protein [Candidatus Bathyarchaeota archaeon]|nr:MAG: 2-oxoacid:acceptor oxidoreductase family protein [Candidatus Bathyarchaeota archaeon]
MEENGIVTLQEVRWHGRGGQGAWTASELLAKAAIYEGKYIQSFPEFGPERMGAPVRAFTRISKTPLRMHCSIYSPQVAVVLDPTLLNSTPVADGLAQDGLLIINTQLPPAKIRQKLDLIERTVWTVPATDIAVRILGRPITNTAMLGAVARATGIVDLKSLERVIKERFPAGIAEKNIGVMKVAYNEARSG